MNEETRFNLTETRYNKVDNLYIGTQLQSELPLALNVRNLDSMGFLIAKCPKCNVSFDSSGFGIKLNVEKQIIQHDNSGAAIYADNIVSAECPCCKTIVPEDTFIPMYFDGESLKMVAIEEGTKDLYLPDFDVTCDECKQGFNLTDQSLKINYKHSNDALIKTVDTVECPHCHAKRIFSDMSQ